MGIKSHSSISGVWYAALPALKKQIEILIEIAPFADV